MVYGEHGYQNYQYEIQLNIKFDIFIVQNFRWHSESGNQFSFYISVSSMEACVNVNASIALVKHIT